MTQMLESLTLLSSCNYFVYFFFHVKEFTNHKCVCVCVYIYITNYWTSSKIIWLEINLTYEVTLYVAQID